MEAKHISSLLPKVQPEQALTEQKPSKSGASGVELKLLQEIETGVRINSAPVKDMEGALRWCMIKVGIRANNLPGKEESAVLYHHIVTYYGNHTVEEFKLAFDMAISGQLDLDDKEVNPYESFDCRYVSKILNAYRIWAKQVVKQNEGKSSPAALPVSATAVDWREQVQQALESFLIGNYNPRLWMAEMYDQVVFDSFLNNLAYYAFIDKARNKLCAEIQKELVDMKPQDESAAESMSSSEYRDYQSLEKKLFQYRSGDREVEVILLAKQMALKHYFSYLKSVEVNKIYQPA